MNCCTVFWNGNDTCLHENSYFCSAQINVSVIELERVTFDFIRIKWLRFSGFSTEQCGALGKLRENIFTHV